MARSCSFTITTMHIVVSLPVTASPAKSRRFVTEGADVGLGIEVEGEYLTYQWQKRVSYGGKGTHTVPTGY